MDGSFRLLDPATFEEVLAVEDAHTKAITALDMPPKMDFILTAGANTMKLWDRSGNQIGEFNGHATSIWNADISNDGKHAVSSAYNKTFLLWDVYNGVIDKQMRGHQDITLSACISPDNRLIASGSSDRTIRIWDLETGEVITTLHGPTGEVYDVAFSPDSKMVAAASGESSIRIYNLEEETLVHILKGHRAAVRRVAFSPNGRYLLSTSEDLSMLLWDVVRGERIHTFTTGNGGGFLDVEFHPDGQSFFSITSEGDLIHWELHPEIFVLRYFLDPYQEELASLPETGPRRVDEDKKEYEARMAESEKIRTTITERYFEKYLESLTQPSPGPDN
jgi:WD40 repeat protein